MIGKKTQIYLAMVVLGALVFFVWYFRFRVKEVRYAGPPVQAGQAGQLINLPAPASQPGYKAVGQSPSGLSQSARPFAVGSASPLPNSSYANAQKTIKAIQEINRLNQLNRRPGSISPSPAEKSPEKK